MKQGPLKFLVAGTGKCGTGYIAKLLTDAGINCGHEAVFNELGETTFIDYNEFLPEDVIKYPIETTGELSTSDGQAKIKKGFRIEGAKPGGPYVGDASWHCVPFLGLLGLPVLHIVRHPLDVITSFVHTAKLFKPGITGKHVDYMYRFYQWMPRDPVAASACYWMECNKRIEAYSSIFPVPIESSTEPEFPDIISSFVIGDAEIAFDPDVMADAVKNMPPRYNESRNRDTRPPRITWEEIPEPYRGLCQRMCVEYGYSL